MEVVQGVFDKCTTTLQTLNLQNYIGFIFYLQEVSIKRSRLHPNHKQIFPYWQVGHFLGKKVSRKNNILGSKRNGSHQKDLSRSSLVCAIKNYLFYRSWSRKLWCLSLPFKGLLSVSLCNSDFILDLLCDIFDTFS